MPYYLVFVFAFFFGNFGSPEGVSDGTLPFKYLCFLYSWFLLATSLFVFISFQIPSWKEYLYNLLGKDYVISCIGKKGVTPLIKVGGVAVGFVAGNEISKELDHRQKVGAANAIAKNYQDMVQSTGKPADANSKEFKKVIDTQCNSLRNPATGAFDRNEERVASGHIVDSVKNTVLKGIGWRK